MVDLLDLSGLPDDPMERLAALLDVEEQVTEQLEKAYAWAYFDARFSGQIEHAIDLHRHPRRDILAMTRRLNREGGGAIRWGDGVDRSSTTFRAGDDDAG
jgi:diadenosine tetraphosphate (Ap4A) HIT family hydrolase